VKHEVTTDRVLTLPNVLSFLRLLGVPLFLWLLLVPRADGWALMVLAVSSITDWLDGYLARRWNQISRVGQLLDPLADRLYTLAAVLAFVVRDIVPWWFAALVVARDVMLLACVPALRSRGLTALPVHFLGKAATFNLFLAMPLLLVGDGVNPVAEPARVFGWALAIWGVSLYLYAGILYVLQTRRVVAATPPQPRR